MAEPQPQPPLMALPGEDTNAGAMARMMIIETLAPFDPGYDPDESLVAMRLMRQTIENRLASPAEYLARGAANEEDIIRLGNQFEGFRDYPTLPSRLATKLNSIVLGAIKGNVKHRAAYIEFINNAVTAASEAISPAVARYPGVTAWRTSGHGAPKGRFRLLAIVQGNSFYATTPVPPLAHSHHHRGRVNGHAPRH